MALSIATSVMAQDPAQPQAVSDIGSAASAPFRPPMSTDELVNAPSPGVASMPQVRAAEIDLSSGSATLTIPLIDWAVGGSSVGIGLGYRVGAFSTEEQPGWIGLGWNLQGVYAVSRSVAGLPDEYTVFDLRNPENADAEYFDRLLKYHADAAIDRYSYTLPGGSGQFTLSPSGTINEFPSSNNLIELIGEKNNDKVRDFRITTPDGTQYEFTERERSTYQYNPASLSPGSAYPGYEAVTSWYLSRMITPEGADTVRYEYASHSPQPIDHTRPSETLTLRQDPQGRTTPDGSKIAFLTSSAGDDLNINRTSFFNSKIIKKISSRTASVDFTLNAPFGREANIEAITLFDHTGQPVKTVKFSSATSQRRPTLNEITVTGPDGVIVDHLSFEYHSDNIHHIGDFFGYPNASAAESYSISTLLDPNTLSMNTRRKPSFNHALAAALKKMTSATGVTTEYEYEPNTIARSVPHIASDTGKLPIILPFDSLIVINPIDPIDPTPPAVDEQDITVTIGLRLKSVTQTDRITGRKLMREFIYADGLCNVDFSYLTISDFIALSGQRWFYMPNASASLNIITVNDTSSSLLYGSRSPGYRPEAARIFYGTVSERISGTGIDHPLLTVYRFDLSRCPLKYLRSGREISSLPGVADNRSLAQNSFPISCRDHQMRRFGSHTVRGYFREHIGANPELAERTVYRYANGSYTPAASERYFYTTADSTSFATSLFYESMVRQEKAYSSGMIKNDILAASDMNCFSVITEASRRVIDSVATVTRFADGSERVRGVRYAYTGLKPISGGSLSGQLPFFPIDSIKILPPGTIVLPSSPQESSSLLMQVGETVSEGGHTVSRRMRFADMVSDEFFKQACKRGLRTLPVSEKWVIDRADTLTRTYSYDLFPTAKGRLTRVAEIISSVNSSVTERMGVNAYSPHGHPASITRTGRPATLCCWGYCGDLLTAMTIADTPDQPAIALTTGYEYQPLIGCSRIVEPSGRSQSFTYSGGRLSGVSDTRGRLMTAHSYEFHAMASGTHAGRNLISTTHWTDSGLSATATTLFDGFGCSIADISEGAGGDGSDVTAITRYDALSRPVKAWTPMPLTADLTADALKRDTPLLSAASSEFGDATPFSAMTYPEGEATTMAKSTTIAGDKYAGHPTLTELTCSNPIDKDRRVVRWRWDGARLRADGFYAAGELDAVRSVDGDGRVSYLFTDCMGRTVMQRALADGGRFADTYTVSDPWGNPLLVIPPEASERLGCAASLSVSDEQVATILRDYAFIYRYDSRLRLRSKKLPGCEAIEMAYDRDNRLAFTRDGNQRRSGRRSFMLYDPLGRPAVTGTCRDALSDDLWAADESIAPTMTATIDPAAPIASTICASGYSIDSSLSDQLAEGSLLTATFYDGYSFLRQRDPLGIFTAPPQANTQPLGLATGMLTAVLGPGADTIPPLLSVSFFDIENHPIATLSASHRGDILKTLSDFNLAGQPVKVTTELLDNAGQPTLMLDCESTYDRHGRPATGQLIYKDHVFNLGRTAYDRLGHIASTTYEGDITRSFTYDLHGWLTEWTCKDISQSLSYASGANPSYTGRISQKTTISPNRKNTYDYVYDKLGRLIEARSSGFDNNGLGSFGPSRKTDHSTAYSYDLNGNTLTLKRNGAIARGLYSLIDDIKATYCGNRITSLRDDATNVILEASLDVPNGSWSGSDFEYDGNGNQTRDLSRGVADIEYNDLNLPARVEMVSGGTIEYLYTAAGTKLAEFVRDSDDNQLNRRDYVELFEFNADSLRIISLASGYISVADTTFHLYVHDHQGNVAGVYNTRSGALEQFTDYYPYGLPHAMTRVGDKSTNRRLYSAKELTTDHGLNTYDFAARHLAPAFPRFTTVDPMATDYHPISPYTYCGGDPINQVDPTGQFIETIWDIGNMIYDIGAAAYNHITGDHDKAKEHWIDAGTDAIATIIPFVPAGATKAARATYKATNAVTKANNHISPNKIAKTAAIPIPQPQKAQNRVSESQTQDKNSTKDKYSEHTKGKRNSTSDKHTARRSGQTYGQNKNKKRGDKNRKYEKGPNPNKRKSHDENSKNKKNR